MQGIYTTQIIPDGKGGFEPCPQLLTEQEAIRFLRLDVGYSGDPSKTIEYYRNSGQLIAIKVGKKNRYWRGDLESFLEQKSSLKRQRASM